MGVESVQDGGSVNSSVISALEGLEVIVRADIARMHTDLTTVKADVATIKADVATIKDAVT